MMKKHTTKTAAKRKAVKKVKRTASPQTDLADFLADLL